MTSTPASPGSSSKQGGWSVVLRVALLIAALTAFVGTFLIAASMVKPGLFGQTCNSEITVNHESGTTGQPPTIESKVFTNDIKSCKPDTPATAVLIVGAAMTVMLLAVEIVPYLAGVSLETSLFKFQGPPHELTAQTKNEATEDASAYTGG